MGILTGTLKGTKKGCTKRAGFSSLSHAETLGGEARVSVAKDGFRVLKVMRGQ